MKIAVTGHRPNKLGDEYNLVGPYSDHIRTELQKVIDDLHPTLMISGMALGVDTIWAELAVKNKIDLMAVIPFPSQDKVWRLENKIVYKNLLNYAQHTGGVFVTGTDPYEAWKMSVRNEYMVRKCDLLVAVYNGDKSGGTFNCIEYANSVSKSMLKINPNPQTNEDPSKSDFPNSEEQSRMWSTLNDELY